jgi:CCR4-NOT transcription complex subunit 1
MDKAKYLDSLLALVIFVFNHQFETRTDASVHKIAFRFFSSLFYEFKSVEEEFADLNDRILDILANSILALQPAYFPSFTFHWCTLIAHRFFMPRLLRTEQVSFAPVTRCSTI